MSKIVGFPTRLCSILFGVLLTLFSATQLWLSQATKSSASEPTICRFWLCPIDPQIARGFERYFESTPAETPLAVDGFRLILTRDPASSYRWCDLGEALLESGDTSSAMYCFERASQLAPNSAHILLRALNFHFRIEDFSGALRYANNILTKTAEYDEILFSSFDRMGVPVDRALQTGIPTQRRPVTAFLRHLIAFKKPDDSQKAWDWARVRGFLDDGLAADYVNLLLLDGRQRAAVNAWTLYLGGRAGDFPKLNLLFNGDFEAPPTRCLMDWQVDAVEGVRAAADSGQAYSGRSSMKIQFGGKDNVAYRHLWQVAVVGPGVYRLQAYFKTEEISTDQGVGLHVYDLESPQRLNIVFPAITGSHDWMQQQEVFTAPPQTGVLRVELVRQPSKKFDNKITGSVWVDAVKLQRQ